jgi:hypothetical protein
MAEVREEYAMADMWSAWQSECERQAPFAEEWKEGRVEDFIRNLLNTAAKKRQQRDALLSLVEEVRNLHVTHQRLLAFFDLERACQLWAAENCSADQVDRVLAALAEWQAQLLRHGAGFPLSEGDTRTFARMQARLIEAQAAVTTIRPCFEVLDAALSSGSPEPENPDVAESVG